MDPNFLRELISQPEGLKLEFKRKFYKISHENSEIREREWGELTKDILSLANGNVNTVGQTAYLIVGADDKLTLGRRALYDVGEPTIRTKQLLEHLKAAADPPFADLSCEKLLIDGKTLLVISIPPSPHLYETKNRIVTSKGAFSEYTVFVRRNEHIYPASIPERTAILSEKLAFFARDAHTGQSSIGSIKRSSQVHAYLDGIIVEERKSLLDSYYVPLSAETQPSLAAQTPPLFVEQTNFPQTLIRNEFRFMDLSSEPYVVDKQALGSIEQALQLHSRFVLLGSPGSGKTTSLNKLRLDAARRALVDETQPIPLLINLARWPEAITDIPSLLTYEGNLKGLPPLHFAHLLILLDGLNEMPAAKYVERLKSIEEWLEANPSASAIISCRERFYLSHEKLSIPVVQVHPLDETRIELLLNSYLGAERGRLLLSQLQSENPAYRSPRDLIHLASNPYMLSMMAYVYSQFGSLPTSRGQLFQNFVKTLYERERDRGNTGGLTYEQLIAGLGGLAVAMHAKRSATAVPTDWAARHLPREIPSEPLWSLGIQATLLTFSNDDSLLQFYHQLLLEYFAAEGLLKKSVDLKEIKRPRFDHKGRHTAPWDEVVYTLVGITEPNEILPKIAAVDPFLAVDCLKHIPSRSKLLDDSIDAVVSGLFSYFGSKNLEAKRAAVKKVTELGELAVPQLLFVLESGIPVEKRAALEALAQIPGLSGITGVVIALDDHDRWVRRDALAIIEDLDSQQQIEVGMQLFERINDQGESLSRETLKAFSWVCSLQNITLVKSVIDLLESGDEVFIRNITSGAADPLVLDSIFQTVFLALRVVDDAEYSKAVAALKVLMAKLHERTINAAVAVRDAYRETQSQMILELFNLAQFFDDRSRQTALELLRDLNNSFELIAVQNEVATGVSALTNFLSDLSQPDREIPARTAPAPRLPIAREPVHPVQALLMKMRDPDPDVGHEAVVELARLGEVAVGPLIRALNGKPTERRRAPRALARIGNRRAIGYLRSALLDHDWRVRKHAVLALGKLQDKEGLHLIERLFYDSATDVRIHAIRVHGALLEEPDLALYTPLLYDARPQVAIEAASVLLRWEYPPAVDRLAALLHDDETSMSLKVHTASVLGKAGKIACTALSLAMADAEGDLLETIINATSRIGCAETVANIVNALVAEDVSVRRTASAALGKFLCADAVDPLINALNDIDYVVRINAIDSLALLKNDKAIQPISMALLDEDNLLRVRAARALRKFSPVESVNALETAINDPDPEVLFAVADSLGALGGSRAVELLERLTFHPEVSVRFHAVRALSLIADAQALSIITGLAKSANKTSRMLALSALGRIGDREMRQILIDALDDTDPDIRWRAAASLGDFGDPSMLEILERLAGDTNYRVRRAAAEAIRDIVTSATSDISSPDVSDISITSSQTTHGE